MAENHLIQNTVQGEVWKPVVGFEAFYSVSNMGRVRRDAPGIGLGSGSGVAGRILRPGVSSSGYCHVTFHAQGSTTMCSVHKAVMLAFVGERPAGHEVNHKDTDKTNNHLANLEYVTHLENQHHAAANNRYPSGPEHHFSRHPELAARGDNNGSRRHPESLLRGTDHYLAAFTEEDILGIRSAVSLGVKQSDLAAQYGVTRQAIWQIAHKKNWKHVT